MSRLLHLASFAVSSLPLMLWQSLWRPDVVLAIEPPLFSTPQAWLTARLSGAKAWLHIQDFEMHTAIALGILPKGPLQKLAARFESWFMSRFDRVSSISNRMVSLLKTKGVSPSRTVLLPNWVNTGIIGPGVDGAAAFRSKHGIQPEHFVVLYSGSMGQKQGLEVVLDAAAILVDQPHLLFLLCGDGPVRSPLEKMAIHKGLTNVKFLPLQAVEHFPALLSATDVHLVTQKRGPADLVMPSKLTNILAVGGWAVITAEEDTELGSLIQDHPGIGLLCEPENGKKLALLISNLMKTRSGTKKKNAVARSYATEYLDMDGVLSHFELELAQLKNIETKHEQGLF